MIILTFVHLISYLLATYFILHREYHPFPWTPHGALKAPSNIKIPVILFWCVALIAFTVLYFKPSYQEFGVAGLIITVTVLLMSSIVDLAFSSHTSTQAEEVQHASSHGNISLHSQEELESLKKTASFAKEYREKSEQLSSKNLELLNKLESISREFHSLEIAKVDLEKRNTELMRTVEALRSKSSSGKDETSFALMSASDLSKAREVRMKEIRQIDEFIQKRVSA